MKSKRFEFTRLIAQLINEMILYGEMPIIDYVKRGVETQKALFEAGKSKCDGIKKMSKHQSGLAMDIYFIDKRTGDLSWNRNRYLFWHDVWHKEYGGRKMIKWDMPHFEYKE